MQPFDFYKNRERIQQAVNDRIKRAGLSDPEGFTLIEGITIPVVKTVVQDVVRLEGRVMPQVAVVGNSTGLIYYFYLDKLLPGEGLD